MKAVIIEGFGNLDQIKLGDIPTPEPQANEVQIQIKYAAINPVDWKICEGLLRERI
jgi:NADPH:quinone reductase-like Zn-dependent oxidoreductase